MSLHEFDDVRRVEFTDQNRARSPFADRKLYVCRRFQIVDEVLRCEATISRLTVGNDDPHSSIERKSSIPRRHLSGRGNDLKLPRLSLPLRTSGGTGQRQNNYQLSAESSC